MALLPTLFLNIEQGPKAGCRLECQAAAISSVGRGRANTLQISRDTGISQKHLRFQWRDGDKDDDVHVGWTAMDVGSSNGTFFNGFLVEPHKEIYIQTGDLIKIGSETTIRVEILGVADENMTVTKLKECPKRKGSCIASESHGKGMSVAGRHARKAGRTAGKALAAQLECESKQLDVMEVEVYHGKHHVNNAVTGHSKQNDGMTDKVYHNKQHSNIAEEGHGNQQEESAGLFSGNEHTNSAVKGHGKQGGNKTAYGHHEDKHDINNEAEEGQRKQVCSTTDQVKHGINNVGKGKHDNTAKKSRDHEHETKILAESVNINLSMTVEQWFRHLMEEGPKYLHRVSENIIQDVMLESKQFDEYVLSLS